MTPFGKRASREFFRTPFFIWRFVLSHTSCWQRWQRDRRTDNSWPHTHTATLYPHTRTHTHMLHLTDWSHEPWESNCLTFAVIVNVLHNCRCCCCICCRACCYCCCDRLRCLCAFTVVYPEPLANWAFVSAASSLCICSSWPWPWPWPWALRIVFATCGFPFPRCTLFQLIPRQQQQQRRQ